MSNNVKNHPYGGGNVPISHMTYFQNFSGESQKRYKNLWDEQLQEINSCIDENDKKGFTTQITLTNSQLFTDPEYKKLFDELMFKEVFRHTNPNTKRIIHTFMRHPQPIVDEKSVLVKPIRPELNSSFWQQMYARNENCETFRQIKPGTTQQNIHGGGCCGWGACWGLNPTDTNFMGYYAKTLGEIRLSTRGLAWQFCMPKFMLNRYDEMYEVYYKNWFEKGGFKIIDSFTHQLTGLEWCVFAKSENEIAL